MERITGANCALFDIFAELVYKVVYIDSGTELPAAFEDMQPTILAVYQSVVELYVALRVGAFRKEVAAHNC